jgi:hypothetical protein
MNRELARIGATCVVAVAALAHCGGRNAAPEVAPTGQSANANATAAPWTPSGALADARAKEAALKELPDGSPDGPAAAKRAAEAYAAAEDLAALWIAGGQSSDGTPVEEVWKTAKDSIERLRKKVGVAPPPPAVVNVSISAEDDDRRAGRPPRQLGMMLVELGPLNSLLASVAAADKRAMLLHRVAEDYAEVAEWLSAGGGDPKLVAIARRCELEALQRNYAESPDYKNRDAVVYYLALAHERFGNTSEARRLYDELVRMSGSSPLVPRAQRRLAGLGN